MLPETVKASIKFRDEWIAFTKYATRGDATSQFALAKYRNRLTDLFLDVEHALIADSSLAPLPTGLSNAEWSPTVVESPQT